MSAQGTPFTNLKRTAAEAENPLPVFEVLLDNLRSTLNVGSIFRTADGAGVHKIYCAGTTPTPEHPKIAKTGLGAEDFIPWEYVRNGFDLACQQKAAGVTLLSLEAAPQAQSLVSFPPFSANQHYLFIVGNEVSGIDPEIIALSDVTLFIPMRGKKSSLNVAVAFGIAAYVLLDSGKKS
jgi:tRNA G18 (ribose-2'-O)-methylase SpoU